MSVCVVTFSCRIKKNLYKISLKDTVWYCYIPNRIQHRLRYKKVMFSGKTIQNTFFVVYFYAKVTVEKLVLKLKLELRVSSRNVGHTWLSPTLMCLGGKPLQREAGSESDTARQYFLYESSISAGKGIYLIHVWHLTTTGEAEIFCSWARVNMEFLRKYIFLNININGGMYRYIAKLFVCMVTRLLISLS